MKKDRRTLPLFSADVTTVYRCGRLKGHPKYPDPESKRCVKCKETFLLTSFHLSNVNPDGRRNDCIVCRNAYRRKMDKRRRKAAKLEQKKREMVQQELVL